MLDLLAECELVPLSSADCFADFDCGDADLNEFFNIDAIKYQEQMLGQTYFFRHKSSRKVVCAFSLSPDSLNTVNLGLIVKFEDKKRVKSFNSQI